MTYQLNQRELLIDLSSGSFDIRRIHDPRIVGPVDYGWMRYAENPDVFTWGGGPLAESRIPGSRRLVFCAHSPAWEGFYISSMGGGAYVMHRVGVDFFCLTGAAPEDSVLILNHNHGEIEVQLKPINADTLWTGYADPDGRRLIGFFALQQAVFDRYGSEYDGDWVRVFAVYLPTYLTPEQCHAILHTGTPLLIIAGPGPGKTEVLTWRVAHLVRAGLVAPERLLHIASAEKTTDEYST